MRSVSERDGEREQNPHVNTRSHATGERSDSFIRACLVLQTDGSIRQIRKRVPCTQCVRVCVPSGWVFSELPGAETTDRTGHTEVILPCLLVYLPTLGWVALIPAWKRGKYGDFCVCN